NHWIHSSSFLFPRRVDSLELRVRKGRRTQRGKCRPPDSDSFSDAECEKIPLTCQANLPQARIAASNSRNAVSFSLACTFLGGPLRDQTDRERMNRPLWFQK